jgi:hypothetical protein
MKKFLKEKRPILRKLFFLGADAVMIILSVFSAFLIRFEGDIPERYLLNIQGIII